MKKFFAMIFVVFLLTACLGNAPTQTDADAVGTVVAGTLTALPSATSIPQPTATLTAEPTATFTPEPTTVLPRSLYYLAKDLNDLYQIFRLERDGVTITQITDIDGGVSSFDISPLGGSIAFTAKDRLFISDSNGGNREPIVRSTDSEILAFPLWSPDGKMIVYRFGSDVVVYSIDTGKDEILFAGSKKEDIYPISFSPDGSKLLIRKHRIPSSPESPVFIYNFASQVLIPIIWANQPYPCFGPITWDTSDSFFCHSHVLAGGVLPGLWRVNANDGSVESLVESFQSPFVLVNAPHRSMDGSLYYLYGEDQGITYSYLSLVQSDADGVINRTILRPEVFNVLDALWTPDGSAILIVQNDGTRSIPTNMILVPVDSSLPVVTILEDASTLNSYLLRWGP